ncbi:MAG: Holliday junction resolvase Hjc [archaeon]
MNLKKKGTDAERDLVSKLWATGSWGAVRVAGSGSMHYPSADIIASNKTRIVAIECKVTKDEKKYFEKSEIVQLLSFCEYFGAEAWIAIKFVRSDWIFFSIENLEEKENCYLATKERSDIYGLTFEEFLG